MTILNPLFYVQAIMLALGQIWANKMRSFLTALGIIIGVASVTSVIAALSGLKTKVLSEMESFGASKLLIFPDHPDEASENEYGWREIRLKPEELSEITSHCPSIKQVTPRTGFGASITSKDKSLSGVDVVGIWPQWHEIENRQVIMGRPFTSIDEESARQVCLINDQAIAEMRLDTDPTGSYILINNRRFLIVGVVETREASMFGPSTISSEVFVPFSTAARMQDPMFFFFITCQTLSPDVSEEAKAEVRFLLRKLRNLGPGEPDTFQIAALDQFIQQFRAVAAVITMVAGGIVGISLLVGGIGIMNIMLVSVSERTREIGLRKAVGATPVAILLQFLLEAVTLCCVGGFIGLACGEGFALLLSSVESLDLKTTVPWWAVVLAFAFSAAVGVIFGMFPAIKAARLDPIDALRHE
jgi:putative ABC transport system permease protein